MKKEQAFKEITSQHKWYIGLFTSGYATQIKQRFKAGQLKQSTIEHVLEHFGYVKTKEEEWSKKSK